VNRTPVTSSNIAEIGYETGSMTLEVAFKSGAVYQYYDVPETMYQSLMQADSHGRFLNANIKGSYRDARL
jgi:hypothetical protein